jgi:SRSO17 transposase
VFLAHVGPRGRALVDKRLYLPKEWTQDPERCAEAQVPPDQRTYQSKSDLALLLLRQAKQWGQLTAEWVTGDDEYGKAPEFRDGVAGEGWKYVLEVPSNTPVWPTDPTWVTAPYRGRGRPPQPHPVPAERQEVRERAAALPPEAWHVLTVAEGAQGPRTYRFACERVQDSRDHQPGVEVWLIHRQNLDGSEPRYYFSNAPRFTAPRTLARVSASRWPIETEFEDGKSHVALDEYEVRRWPGWHHHVTMCLLANAFLLTLQQEWGEKDAPDHPAAGASDRLRTAAAQALDPRRTAGVAPGNAAAERAGEAIARQTAVAAGAGAGPDGDAGPRPVKSSL